MFLLRALFMDTAATIPTGAMAERWRFSSFVVYGFFMSMFLYPLYGNWVWGGGFLGSLGVNLGPGPRRGRLRGLSVVHMTGGVTAFAGTIGSGRAIGKFRRDGTIGVMPGHNLPLALLGTPGPRLRLVRLQRGSTLAASDPRIAEIAVNTLPPSSAGAMIALFRLAAHRRPDIAMACNGSSAAWWLSPRRARS